MISDASVTTRLPLIAIIIVLFVSTSVVAKNVSMKIVVEPASYGFLNNVPSVEREEPQLIARATPSNFSGPCQFKSLIGKCFNFTSDHYRYRFCPFFNLTQYELSFRWNAYRGILGIWREWKIENYTFSAMVFSKGDECGTLDRSVEVYFRCGPKNKLINVTEPEKCFYAATFATPLVCHRDAMLVYPRLPEHLRRAWDELETELINGDVTKKGYAKRRRKLFQSAGFQSSIDDSAVKVLKDKPANASTSDGPPFSDLAACNVAYEELKEQVHELRKEVEGMKFLLDLK